MIETKNKLSNGAIITLTLVLLWLILGFIAFVMSLICFGRTGTQTQHVIGLIIAVLFGPIYFIFHYSINKYCKKI